MNPTSPTVLWNLTRCSPCAVAAWALCASLGAAAESGSAPTPHSGQDYFAWQIASGDPLALREHFDKHRALPYLRIERRGAMHVLRAGMWDSAEQARAALASVLPAGALIRIATYRPDTIVQRNWEEGTSSGRSAPQAGPNALAPLPSKAPPSVQAPLPLALDASMRPFQQGDYALAFQVFVGTGDLAGAMRVASRAVASVPTDQDWRRKLARLADGANQPLVAWEHWHYLFSQGDKSDETTAAVLRLTPLAGRSDVAVAVWKLRAQRAALSPTQWQDLLRMVEEGDDIDSGVSYFEQQYRRWNDPVLLEYAARLAYNTGDDTRALALYTERVTLEPFSQDSLMRAVLLHIRGDRLRQALALMQSHSASVPAEMDEFWRIMGSTAWDLRETAAAEGAYRRYTQSPKATAADWSRLVYLARLHAPQSGADLALEGYRRWGRLEDLMLSLNLYAQIPDYAAQGRALQTLTPEDRALAEQQTAFLLLRGRYHQHHADSVAAQQDYERAYALAPQDSQAGLGLLWFLIDQKRSDALRALVRQLEPQGRENPDYWLALAAAQQTLEQPREALRWYQKLLRHDSNDALLLMNYADTLQAVRRVGMADRVRRHAWLMLRTQAQTARTEVPNDQQAQLLAWTRLRLQNQSSDANLRMLRDTVSQLRGLDNSALKAHEQIQLLVLGWAVSTSQFANARSWMWLQQARKGTGIDANPAWGLSQVALQLGDTATMQALLDTRAQAMPVYNRYDTAYALGREHEALELLFESMLRDGNDENLHDRQRQHAPQAANYLQLQLQDDQAGDLLQTRSHQLDAVLAFAPNLHLLLGWSEASQSTQEPTLGTLLPGTQHLTRAGLRLRTPATSTELQLFGREELASGTGASVAHTWTAGRDLVLNATLGYHMDSSDTVALRVAGSQDQMQLSALYALDRRMYARASTRWAQFFTQRGDAVGQSLGNEMELGYRLRLDYPDVRLRVYGTNLFTTPGGASATEVLASLPVAFATRITAAGIDPLSYFLPPSATTWGACVDVGENMAGQNLQQTYTRALRLFSQLCALDQSRSGSGYSTVIGVAGAVLGADHLLFRLEQNESGLGNLGGALGRTWSLRYRYYF